MPSRRENQGPRGRGLAQAVVLPALRARALGQGPAHPSTRFQGRVVYLVPEGEGALYRALHPAHRALFLVSRNTGLRWSEQRRLTWRSARQRLGRCAPAERLSRAPVQLGGDLIEARLIVPGQVRAFGGVLAQEAR